MNIHPGAEAMLRGLNVGPSSMEQRNGNRNPDPFNGGRPNRVVDLRSGGSPRLYRGNLPLLLTPLELFCWYWRLKMKNSSINQAKGKLREMKGRVKEGFGEMTNNNDVEARGKGEKIAGKLQKKVGDVQQVFED